MRIILEVFQKLERPLVAGSLLARRHYRHVDRRVQLKAVALSVEEEAHRLTPLQRLAAAAYERAVAAHVGSNAVLFHFFEDLGGFVVMSTAGADGCVVGDRLQPEPLLPLHQINEPQNPRAQLPALANAHGRRVCVRVFRNV